MLSHSPAGRSRRWWLPLAALTLAVLACNPSAWAQAEAAAPAGAPAAPTVAPAAHIDNGRANIFRGPRPVALDLPTVGTFRLVSVLSDERVRMLNIGQAAAQIDNGLTAWMLVSSALVLLMVPGLALFYGGMVRAKNVLNMFLCCMVAIGVVGLHWVIIGYAIAFPANAPVLSIGGWNILGFDPGSRRATLRARCRPACRSWRLSCSRASSPSSRPP